MKTAVEMTGYGCRGKPKAGFPLHPQPLEIAMRFPHSHRRDGFLLTKIRKEAWQRTFLLLQAHRSIRKCSVPSAIPGSADACPYSRRRSLRPGISKSHALERYPPERKPLPV